METTEISVIKKEVDNYRIRFSDALWTKDLQDIVVGGAGGIGSWVCLFLARIGHIPHIYDFDTVGYENLGGQLYGENSISTSKVDAIKDNILSLCGKKTEVSIYNKLYDIDGLVSPIMISCFDSMEARKIMFENWKSQEDRELFIDGRMLAELGMAFFVTKGNEEAYEATLFDDSEVSEADCSYKATSHCGATLASIMIGGLNNYIFNKVLKINARPLPFMTEFNYGLFEFKSI